jgi:hypothetical protein
LVDLDSIEAKKVPTGATALGLHTDLAPSRMEATADERSSKDAVGKQFMTKRNEKTHNRGRRIARAEKGKPLQLRKENRETQEVKTPLLMGFKSFGKELIRNAQELPLSLQLCRFEERTFFFALFVSSLPFSATR